MRLVLVGGGPEEQRLRTLLPGAAFLGVLHGDALGRRTPASTCSCTPAATRPTASPRRRRWPPGCRSSRREPAGWSTWWPTGSPGCSTSPVTRPSWRRVGRLADDTLYRRRMGLAARRSVGDRSWRAVNERLVDHYRSLALVGSAGRLVA